jgi:hypothetical protein
LRPSTFRIGLDASAAKVHLDHFLIGLHFGQQAFGQHGMAFAVSTAAGNTPALALYQALGFVPYRYGVVDPEALPLVKLRRAA